MRVIIIYRINTILSAKIDTGGSFRLERVDDLDLNLDRIHILYVTTYINTYMVFGICDK